MGIKVTFSPIFTINAYFLGTSECYIYGNNKSKTLDENNLYLRFACAMYQKIGESSEIIPVEKVMENIGENSRESSINPKMSINNFEPEKFKTGSRGILQVIPMAIDGKVYYKIIDFTAKSSSSANIPPPAAIPVTAK